MPSQDVMKSVLAGFLGTYTSRYSDYEGYWLLGLAESDLSHLSVDLLDAGFDGDLGPYGAEAAALAVRRFPEQLLKAGFKPTALHEAGLNAHQCAEPTEGWQGDFISDGHRFEFSVRAMMDNGRVYEASRAVFIAPHNPAKERRRNPDLWGT